MRMAKETLREAAEHADEHGQRAAADAVDDAAGSGDGAGAVVGRHEERAEQQAAGQEVVEHPLDVGVAAAVFAAEDERQQATEPMNDTGMCQVMTLRASRLHAADEQRERAHLTEQPGIVPRNMDFSVKYCGSASPAFI